MERECHERIVGRGLACKIGCKKIFRGIDVAWRILELAQGRLRSSLPAILRDATFLTLQLLARLTRISTPPDLYSIDVFTPA